MSTAHEGKVNLDARLTTVMVFVTKAVDVGACCVIVPVYTEVCLVVVVVIV